MCYKNLKQVAILLKRFLAIHNFNNSYYGKLISAYLNPTLGGLSSYSTVILIIAYMNYYGMRSPPPGYHPSAGLHSYYYGGGFTNPTGGDDFMTPARLLMGFLDFYSNYFNPGTMGISVVNNG
jgi:hypothetical protein